MKLQLSKRKWGSFFLSIIKDNRSFKRNFFSRIPLWIQGYSTDQILHFNLNRNNYRYYLPEINRFKITLGSNYHLWPVLHDKLYFELFVANYLPIIPMLELIVKGVTNRRSKGDDKDSTREWLSINGKYVIKPIQGGGGEGLSIINVTNNKYLLNGRSVSRQNIDSYLSKCEYHGVYPFIKQNTVTSEIYSKTTNTLRITVFRTTHGKVRIFSPVIRIGTKSSWPVDNFNRGGLIGEIDIKSGVIQRACLKTEEGSLKFIENHPDSNEKIIGVKVPMWNEIISGLLQFHQKNPAFDLVGWDVLLGESSWYVIEGNHNPNLRTAFSFNDSSKDNCLLKLLHMKGFINL